MHFLLCSPLVLRFIDRLLPDMPSLFRFRGLVCRFPERGFAASPVFALAGVLVIPVGLVWLLVLFAPAVAAGSPADDPVLVDPVPRRARFVRLVYVMAARSALDPRLVDAVIRTESGYRPHVVSSAGAVGLMQLMPGTARRYGVRNRYDPVQNVSGGTRYLADLLAEFELVDALAAYNAGEGTVRRYGGVPPYAETRRFVGRVLLRYLGTGR